MMRTDEEYMLEALKLARYAADLGEAPIGAVVVKKSSGEIIGRGYNRREVDRSPLAHAEIMALDEASKTLGGWRVVDSVLYVTLVRCAQAQSSTRESTRLFMVQATKKPAPAGRW